MPHGDHAVAAIFHNRRLWPEAALLTGARTLGFHKRSAPPRRLEPRERALGWPLNLGGLDFHLFDLRRRRFRHHHLQHALVDAGLDGVGIHALRQLQRTLE